MTNHLVTIYLVNHNYSRFVGKALQSIFHQTYKPIELIIVDDGSTDDSIEKIEKCLDEIDDQGVKISKVFRKIRD